MKKKVVLKPEPTTIIEHLASNYDFTPDVLYESKIDDVFNDFEQFRELGEDDEDQKAALLNVLLGIRHELAVANQIELIKLKVIK